mgnify:CR=1 FL=1
MLKKFILFFLVVAAFCCKAQEIKPADLIPQKSVIVIPNITKSQLDGIKIEFEKHKEITAATYVYKDHNCLLVTIGNNRVLKHYADLLKMIQVATNITSEQMFLKTPDAYNEILAKDVEGTNVIIK